MFRGATASRTPKALAPSLTRQCPGTYHPGAPAGTTDLTSTSQCVYNVRNNPSRGDHLVKAIAQNSKDARIDLRVNQAEKALLELAAASQGKKLSEFVISSSTEAAQMALADQNRFVLPEAEMKKFLASLEEEPKEIPALRELFARKSVFE